MGLGVGGGGGGGSPIPKYARREKEKERDSKREKERERESERERELETPYGAHPNLIVQSGTFLSSWSSRWDCMLRSGSLGFRDSIALEKATGIRLMSICRVLSSSNRVCKSSCDLEGMTPQFLQGSYGKDYNLKALWLGLQGLRLS